MGFDGVLMFDSGLSILANNMSGRAVSSALQKYAGWTLAHVHHQTHSARTTNDACGLLAHVGHHIHSAGTTTMNVCR